LLEGVRGTPQGPGIAADATPDQAAALRTATEQQLAVTEEDYGRLLDKLPERREGLARMTRRPEVRSGELERQLFDVAALHARVAALRKDIDQLASRIDATWRQLAELPPPAEDEASRRPWIDALTDLSDALLELSLVQAGIRLDSIVILPIDLTPPEALRIARHHRLDWMNARGALVDSWRLIEFTANDLKSGLDLTFSGDIANRGNNPVRFDGTTGRLRVGVEFDAPLTRLAERNIYRQSLIEFQQARRNYYAFVDRVYQGLRDTLRTIDLNEINFELRRAAVQVAISQVDLARLRLGRPPQPGETSELSNTTARDLVQALSDLLNVQNDFLSVWVNYEVQRMSLDLDLGTMRLDEHGMWIDPGQEIGRLNVDPDYCTEESADAAGEEEVTAPPTEPVEDSPVEPADDSPEATE
jgi:hypothetical protein